MQGSRNNRTLISLFCIGRCDKKNSKIVEVEKKILEINKKYNFFDVNLLEELIKA